MEELILPDTSLCSIVRDEIQNPAGGIVRFIESHVPYVEQAVVVDTGSVDGTREVLGELQSKYPNLRIFDRRFNGYADARNYSLKKVETKKALILDADELLAHRRPQNDFEVLKFFIEENISSEYDFDFLDVFPEYLLQSYGHNPRLFSLLRLGKRREYGICENLDCEMIRTTIPNVKIKHFRSSEDALVLKNHNWYWNPERLKTSPSRIPNFQEWKKYNPRRDEFE